MLTPVHAAARRQPPLWELDRRGPVSHREQFRLGRLRDHDVQHVYRERLFDVLRSKTKRSLPAVCRVRERLRRLSELIDGQVKLTLIRFGGQVNYAV